MCSKYGFNMMESITMEQLLDALLEDDPNLIDMHFRPQYKILCSHLIAPTKTFYFEKIVDLNLYFSHLGIEMITRSTHSTKNHAMKPTELNDNVIHKISNLYRHDFDMYGYSTNPGIIEPISSATNSCFQSSAILNYNAEFFNTMQTTCISRDSLLFDMPFLSSLESRKALYLDGKRQIII